MSEWVSIFQEAGVQVNASSPQASKEGISGRLVSYPATGKVTNRADFVRRKGRAGPE